MYPFTPPPSGLSTHRHLCYILSVVVSVKVTVTEKPISDQRNSPERKLILSREAAFLFTRFRWLQFFARYLCKFFLRRELCRLSFFTHLSSIFFPPSSDVSIPFRKMGKFHTIKVWLKQKLTKGRRKDKEKPKLRLRSEALLYCCDSASNRFGLDAFALHLFFKPIGCGIF